MEGQLHSIRSTQTMPQSYPDLYTALGLDWEKMIELDYPEVIRLTTPAYGTRILQIHLDPDDIESVGHYHIRLMGLAREIFEDQYMFELYQDCLRCWKREGQLRAQPWKFLGVDQYATREHVMFAWEARRRIWAGYDKVGGAVVNHVLNEAKAAMLNTIAKNEKLEEAMWLARHDSPAWPASKDE